MAMSWGPIAYGPSCKSARRRSRRLSYDGGLATREQLGVIMDPRPDGLLMLKIMPFVPPYVHLSLRLRLVCKTWNELIVADPWSRTSAPLTSMQCTHATADYMLHYDSRRLDEFVDNWSLCFPMLTSLDFTWNRFLDDAMLISIAQTMCHKLQALSVHGCRKLLEDGMVAVSEHCDLLESLDVGHTLIRMDAVIQVIERNEGLVYLNIDHHILEYEELPALLQANRGFETEHFKCTYNGDISVLNTNENRLRHLSMRHCLYAEPPMLPHKPSMPVPLVMLNMPCIVDLDISGIICTPKDIVAMVFRNKTLERIRDDGFGKNIIPVYNPSGSDGKTSFSPNGDLTYDARQYSVFDCKFIRYVYDMLSPGFSPTFSECEAKSRRMRGSTWAWTWDQEMSLVKPDYEQSIVGGQETYLSEPVVLSVTDPAGILSCSRTDPKFSGQDLRVRARSIYYSTYYLSTLSNEHSKRSDIHRDFGSTRGAKVARNFGTGLRLEGW